MGNDLQAELEPTTNVVPIIDGLPLQDILQSREDALANAVRRVTSSVEQGQNYAAHGSSPVT